MANYWMSTRLRLLGAVVSGLTALTVVLQANSVDDTAGTPPPLDVCGGIGSYGLSLEKDGADGSGRDSTRVEAATRLRQATHPHGTQTQTQGGDWSRERKVVGR